MRRLSKRVWLPISLTMLAVPLTAAALAYGCTAVATLSSNPGAATPGSTVTVTGKFFGTHDPADATSAGPVQVRLGSRTGAVLATANPAGTDRSFSVQVTIPQTAPGDTFLAATQQTASGTDVYGTPARQAFSVMAPPAAAATPAAAAAPAPAAAAPPAVVPSVAAAIQQAAVSHPAAKAKKHCTKFKTVKNNKGKKVKRCAKYSK